MLKNAAGLASLGVLLAACASAAGSGRESVEPAAVGPGLGAAVSESQILALDISIGPDGAGLPPGRGSVDQGAAVYDLQCASCHGPGGANGQPGVPRLTGGIGSLASETPIKTVNSYWPYATGVFDYVRRSMPPTNPRSMSAEDLYAVTAYILSVDGVVPPDAVLDAEALPQVVMPNREGFIPWWPTTPADAR